MKKNALNLTTNLVAFVVTFAISFFLSPYIVRTLGVEANGLIGLSQNFLNYASILTIMLSSMTARFVTVSLRQGDEQAANEYYTASYVSNLIGVAILLPIMTLTVVNFGTWLNVPDHLATDAAVLAALFFAHFLITLALPRWDVGTWATNNLYLDSLRSMQSVLLRGGLILLMFVFLEPNVVYVGVATLTAGVFALAFSGYYKHRFLPDLRIRRAHFRWRRLRDLLGAGFWNSVNNLGGLLSTGFHLLLANLFLGATPMGLLALAMTVPAMANQLAATLSRVFLPSLAFSFAEGDFRSMGHQAKRAMSITSVLVMMPLAALAVFGEAFFALWVPSEDAGYLQMLSIGVAVGLLGACITAPLQNVFVITNSQRRNSTASVAMGMFNVALAVALLLLTDMGIAAILWATAVAVTLKVLLFTIPLAAAEARAKAMGFYGETLRGLGYLAVLIAAGLIVSMVISATSWIGFFVDVALMCLIGTAVNALLLVGREDRALVFSGARRLLRGWLPSS